MKSLMMTHDVRLEKKRGCQRYTDRLCKCLGMIVCRLVVGIDGKASIHKSSLCVGVIRGNEKPSFAEGWMVVVIRCLREVEPPDRDDG